MKLHKLFLYYILALLAAAARGAIELPFAPAGGGVGETVGVPAERALPEAEDYGILELANGERLKVAVERFDAATGLLTVRHPLMRGPVAIEAAGLMRFSVEPSRPLDGDLPGWVLELADGDRIRGEEFVLQDNRVRFRGLYGGELSVARAHVVALAYSATPPVYEGPLPGEEWIIGGVRTYTETPSLALSADDVMGRAIPRMPRNVRVDMRISGYYMFQNFNLNFFAQRPGLPVNGMNSGYQLRFHGDAISLYRALPGQQAQELGSVRSFDQPFRPQMLTTGVRITLLADLDERRFHVLCDDRLIAEFKDSARFASPGRSISFSSSNPLILSELRISRYDGRLEFASRPAVSAENDILRLKSGETLSGDLLSLRQEQAILRTAMGDLTIPVKQLDFVQFRRAARPEPQRPPPDFARIMLLDDSLLTAKIVKIEDGFVWMEHPLAGTVRFPLKGVAGILWRIPIPPPLSPPDQPQADNRAAAPSVAAPTIRRVWRDRRDAI